LALGIEWGFGDETLRLDLEAVGGDGALHTTSGLTNFSEKKRSNDPSVMLERWNASQAQ